MLDSQKQQHGVSSQHPSARSGSTPLPANQTLVTKEDEEKEEIQESANKAQYPSSTVLSLVVLTLCIASFLVGLDQTIVATAVPKITNEFHALGDIAWWTSAYLLTSATLQLVYGRLYTLFNIKHVYLVALVIFCIGSLVCTVAPNSTALIVGRAVAGTGAAGIMSGSVLVLAASCPLEKRASLTGLMFGSLGIASIAGPFIGGALTDSATWRWCFGINLPICVVVIISVCLFARVPLNKSSQKSSWLEKLKQFDVVGTVLLTASTVCFILALQLGGSVYPWSNGRLVALFVVSGMFLLAFSAIQLFIPSQRSFPRTIVRDRNVLLAALYSGFISGAMFVPVTYLPVWFQSVRNASALRSGIMITPTIVAFVVMSGISGGISQGLGYYNPAMFFGSILSAIGGGLLSTLTESIGSPEWIGFQVLYGFGAGAGVPPPMLVIQTILSVDDVPLGVSLVNLVQMLWSSIAVALAQTVFVNGLKAKLTAALPGFDTSTISSSGATQLGDLFRPGQLVEVLPAYSASITRVMYITVAFSCASFMCALGIQWKSMKPQKDQEISDEDETSHQDYSAASIKA